MRKIISHVRRIRKEGIPLWNDRTSIAREGRRFIDEGPDRFRKADRSARIAVLSVVAIIAAIIALLVL